MDNDLILTNTEVWGLQHSIRGARNPMNSWNRSDSIQCNGEFIIGRNDMDLLQRLLKTSLKEGNSHSKFLRQIMVAVDITAPLYWWKEFDTYKVGTVANSTSTMHKLSTTPITIECFERGNYNPDLGNYEWNADDIHSATRSSGKVDEDVNLIIDFLENLRQTYLETQNKEYWYELIRWLPESWLQTRTMTMNYQVLRQIYFDRKVHKLDE